MIIHLFKKQTLCPSIIPESIPSSVHAGDFNKTYFKPIETFQYTHFSSNHPPWLKKRIQKFSSSKTTFEENTKKSKSRLLDGGYPKNLIEKNYQMSNLQRSHRH